MDSVAVTLFLLIVTVLCFVVSVWWMLRNIAYW
jgi:hypothetical protein